MGLCCCARQEESWRFCVDYRKLATFAPGVARDFYYVRKNQSDSRNAIRYRIPDLYLDYIALGGARDFYGLRTNNVSKYFDRLIFWL